MTDEVRARKRAWQARKVAERRAAGLCVRCGDSQLETETLCAQCSQKLRDSFNITHPSGGPASCLGCGCPTPSIRHLRCDDCRRLANNKAELRRYHASKSTVSGVRTPLSHQCKAATISNVRQVGAASGNKCRPRTCSECGEPGPINVFYRESTGKVRPRERCNKCRARAQAEYRKAHRAQAAAYMRAYRLKQKGEQL